jgi:hypothetical protein
MTDAPIAGRAEVNACAFSGRSDTDSDRSFAVDDAQWDAWYSNEQVYCILAHKVPTLCGISNEIGATHCASAARQELVIVSGHDEPRVPTHRRRTYSSHSDLGSMAAKWCACSRTHSLPKSETSCPTAAPPTGLSGLSSGAVVLSSCSHYCSIADGSWLASYWVLIVADGDAAAYLTILPRPRNVSGVEIDLDAYDGRFAWNNW